MRGSPNAEAWRDIEDRLAEDEEAPPMQWCIPATGFDSSPRGHLSGTPSRCERPGGGCNSGQSAMLPTAVAEARSTPPGRVQEASERSCRAVAGVANSATTRGTLAAVAAATGSAEAVVASASMSGESIERVARGLIGRARTDVAVVAPAAGAAAAPMISTDAP